MVTFFEGQLVRATKPGTFVCLTVGQSYEVLERDRNRLCVKCKQGYHPVSERNFELAEGPW